MFWVEALITATQSFTHGISIFGYLAMFFFYLPPDECYYLCAQSIRCAFFGYNVCQKGFVCYDFFMLYTYFQECNLL